MRVRDEAERRGGVLQAADQPPVPFRREPVLIPQDPLDPQPRILAVGTELPDGPVHQVGRFRDSRTRVDENTRMPEDPVREDRQRHERQLRLQQPEIERQAQPRTPFDSTGIRTHVLRSVPVGVVVRDNDPFANHHAMSAADLAGRRWVRLPDGADPVWTAYWTGGAHDDASPVMRTIQECLQPVVWNGTSALAPVDQPLPAGLVVLLLADRPPSEIVVAWPKTSRSPLVRSFVQAAEITYRT
ncbi:LysR substrate-binding domain-containing protein [Saccharopolyspora shandongensis]|uniref:LysR substrate-binding domain-containing protein n=1 Tax=Saccharopolyspora shandongensis TaxID=418495 RepID=UPI0033EB45F7